MKKGPEKKKKLNDNERYGKTVAVIKRKFVSQRITPNEQFKGLTQTDFY